MGRPLASLLQYSRLLTLDQWSGDQISTGGDARAVPEDRGGSARGMAGRRWSTLQHDARRSRLAVRVRPARTRAGALPGGGRLRARGAPARAAALRGRRGGTVGVPGMARLTGGESRSRAETKP